MKCPSADLPSPRGGGLRDAAKLVQAEIGERYRTSRYLSAINMMRYRTSRYLSAINIQSRRGAG